MDPDSPDESGWRGATSYESTSIRAPSLASSPPSPFFRTIGSLGIRIWIPLRDSSGVSPDSMTPSWLVGGRLGHFQDHSKTNSFVCSRITSHAQEIVDYAEFKNLGCSLTFVSRAISFQPCCARFSNPNSTGR
jgi:hypothetical protein